jgi:hypothetical protein
VKLGGEGKGGEGKGGVGKEGLGEGAGKEGLDEGADKGDGESREELVGDAPVPREL